MFGARLGFVVGLVALAVGLTKWVSKSLEAHAAELGADLGKCVATVDAPSPRTDAPAAFDGVTDEPPANEAETVDAAEESLVPQCVGVHENAASCAGGGNKGRRGAIRHAIFVDAATVLRLANSGASPHGNPVVARGTEPSGLKMIGVSTLGVGVHDGDVLTAVEGRSIRTEGEVIAAVVAARVHRAPRVRATFYRGGTRWSLVVEMPYGPPG
jgi:hypothetical protein